MSGHKTKPKKWTEEEVSRLLEMRKNRVPRVEMARLLNRSLPSLELKLKRVGKSKRTYNKAHVQDKYETNEAFLGQTSPRSILDLYAGEKSFYTGKTKRLVTNDKAFSGNTYQMDSLKCLCTLYAQGSSFDLIDLDPFGSAFDCFDLALKMAKKAIIITYGEAGHVRWKRTDFLERHYGIKRIEDFSTGLLIKETQKIAMRNKKILEPVFIKEWKNITRVYYKISKHQLDPWGE